MPQQLPGTFVWEIRWRNPYKPRPEGFPEVMLRVEIERPAGAGAGPCPVEIDECWQEMREYGYGVSVFKVHLPARELPLASKQRIRRRNVWKRMLKKYPLFVEDFYRERIQAQPAHYGDFVPGEFADLVFMRTTLGNLKLVREAIV